MLSCDPKAGLVQEDDPVDGADRHAILTEKLQVVRRPACEGLVGVVDADRTRAHDAAQLNGFGAREQGSGLLQDHGTDRWCDFSPLCQ